MGADMGADMAMSAAAAKRLHNRTMLPLMGRLEPLLPPPQLPGDRACGLGNR